MRLGLLLTLSLAVAVSGCMESPSGEKPVEDNKREAGNNTVFYTDSGFQPKTLTVEQGETVTWLDRSSKDMWVATDIHPRHSRYDGTSLSQHCPGESFDQCESGEEFSFTFNKKGEWGYHNHESAGDTGTVIVN